MSMNHQNQNLIMAIRKSTNCFKTTINSYDGESIIVNTNENNSKIIIQNQIKTLADQYNKAQLNLK